uniref:Ig-like domain-containing protein n=1 Tax=Denticeps clupeoides TaxID=299321 RepID=A0AAY4CKN7_9TELE
NLGLLSLICCFTKCPVSSPTVIHSWTGLYTAATGIKDLPEFVGVNLFDDEVTGNFDSKNNQFEIRQDWVKKLGEKYVEDQIKSFRDFTWKFKEILKMIMTEFNQTGDQGGHTLQQMYGCEWDDEDGATDGYSQFGYDGADFIKLDLKNTDWVAARPEAEIIKQKWNGGEAKFWKNYLEHNCVEWIKKYVMNGKISLERKVPPQVSLLQTDSSSPVVCHATGFYPDKMMISWQKDGQDLHEDVDVGETLSNHDGTFQKRAELKVTPDVWKKNQFTCVVEHKSGDPIHMILTEEKIRTNNAGTGASRQNHQSSCFNVPLLEVFIESVYNKVWWRTFHCMVLRIKLFIKLLFKPE